MKYDPEKMLITINREELRPVNMEDDHDGWRSLSGAIMRLSFEDGKTIEFEAYNIREVETDND